MRMFSRFPFLFSVHELAPRRGQPPTCAQGCVPRHTCLPHAAPRVWEAIPHTTDHEGSGALGMGLIFSQTHAFVLPARDLLQPGVPQRQLRVENSRAGIYLGGGLGSATKRWAQEARVTAVTLGDGTPFRWKLRANGQDTFPPPPRPQRAGHGSTCPSAPFPLGLRAGVGRGTQTFS